LQLKVVDNLGYTDLEVSSRDELIKIIGKEIEKQIGNKYKLSDICNNLGIYDTVNLFDNRTFQLCDLYQFYKYSPHSIDVNIFYDVVTILNQYEPRLF
jgi:hypothetical protein